MADAGFAAVLRGDVFSAGEPLGASGVRIDSDADRGGVEERSGKNRGFGAGRGGATEEARGGGEREAGAGVRRGRDGERILDLPADVRCAAGRVWASPEVSAGFGASFPAALLRADQESGSAGHGVTDAARDGAGRDSRPIGRRLSPLLGGRPVVCAAL